MQGRGAGFDSPSLLPTYLTIDELVATVNLLNMAPPRPWQTKSGSEFMLRWLIGERQESYMLRYDGSIPSRSTKHNGERSEVSG